MIPQYGITHPYCVRFLALDLRAQISALTYTTSRNFPQAKLDSEIAGRFLLSQHSDLYFSLHTNSAHIVLLNLKEFYRKQKRYSAESVHETVTLGCKL